MAYAIVITMDTVWVPDGAGTGILGQNQSNQPGYGGTLVPGSIGNQQSGRLMVAEQVPGADAPTLANFLTALQAAAQDLAGAPAAGGSPILSQPNALGGAPGTPLSIIQTWATGQPINN